MELKEQMHDFKNKEEMYPIMQTREGSTISSLKN